MEFQTSFVDFVNQGLKENSYIGIGNPDAKILFIGKEASRTSEDGYADEWGNHFINGSSQNCAYSVNEKSELKEGWGRNTWSKYQMLTNYIRSEPSDKRFYVDFLKDVFTTEMNDARSKRTATADKSGLSSRKEFFKNSAFIKQFPVVVLACWNYIQPEEIYDIFDVNYVMNSVKEFSKTNKFYPHHNKEGNRLVIHTRQLSGNVRNEMLIEMGSLIKEHLNKLEITI